MKGYIDIGFLRIFGAGVHIHWSALLVMGFVLAMSAQQPPSAAIFLCSYFGILLLHEAGHAWFARRLGYQVFGIYLGVFHGLCMYEAPYDRKDEAIVAWGGVAAQAAIAIPLIVAGHFAPVFDVPGAGTVIVFLGYLSTFLAIVNLAPAPGLDGGKAWSLIPILLAERRRARDRSKITKGPGQPM